jgi:hypothetical protein
VIDIYPLLHNNKLIMAKLKSIKMDDSYSLSEVAFRSRAAAALGISVFADLLDYIVAPIFDMPILGDIFDVITTSLLFRITRSKVSTAINTIEFIPFVGDLLPVYTLSTLLWIIREWRKQQQRKENIKVVERNNKSRSISDLYY